MTLQNAGYMLSRFDVPDVVPLIHYLANCGPDMIQGDRADGSRLHPRQLRGSHRARRTGHRHRQGGLLRHLGEVPCNI